MTMFQENLPCAVGQLPGNFLRHAEMNKPVAKLFLSGLPLLPLNIRRQKQR